ncbi:hypothetical protein PINS_up002446 [Pythium insidiosum]|nr:hypothetical protein PINS_up002446 [Pythium insidiosum]
MGTTDADGVDLFELERLRVLVRYEFADEEVPRADLIHALRQCHNSTREAYHLLKEKRRQARVAAMDAAMPDNGENNNSSNNNASNGHKRRLDGTPPADDEARSKRSRVSDVGIVDVDLTQPTQQPPQQQQPTVAPVLLAPAIDAPGPMSDEDVTAALATAEMARSCIESALNGDSMIDQLVQRALEALGVVAAPHVSSAVLVAVDALAVALHHVDDGEHASTRDDRVSALMDVLLALPRESEERPLTPRIRPSEDELSEIEQRVESAFAEVAGSDSVLQSRARAAETAIQEITRACKVCVERFEWFGHEARAARKRKAALLSKMNALKSSMDQRLKVAGDAVAKSEATKRDARADALRSAQRLESIMAPRRQALEVHGRHATEAWLVVSREILTATDPAVVQLREAWDASNRNVEAREKGVERAARHLHYFQKLHVLLELVITRRREWIQEKHTRFDRARQASQDRVSALLFQFVPKLTRVLREYYDFHTICQKRAAIERESQEVQLREHHEWFGDGTPASTKDIRQKIQEFTGVIHRSTQRMREAATCQAELWEGKRDLLPVKVFNLIAHEYEMLWSTLNGGGQGHDARPREQDHEPPR